MVKITVTTSAGIYADYRQRRDFDRARALGGFAPRSGRPGDKPSDWVDDDGDLLPAEVAGACEAIAAEALLNVTA